jgi:hypothetical protein
MNVFDLLKGKKVKVMTDAKVEVELEIKEIKQHNHSTEIGESNAANDWWPETRDWTTFSVTFTNGFVKEYSSLNDINVLP